MIRFGRKASLIIALLALALANACTGLKRDRAATDAGDPDGGMDGSGGSANPDGSDSSGDGDGDGDGDGACMPGVFDESRFDEACFQ